MIYTAPCIVFPVSDPHHFNADPDPAFYFNAETDQPFHFNVGVVPDPDPAPNRDDANLRPLAYRPFQPPFWVSTVLYG